MNKNFIPLALAAVVGLFIGGFGGSYLKGSEGNWMFFFFNVVVVVMGLYVILHRKDKGEKEKISWAERKELEKKKKRK